MIGRGRGDTEKWTDVDDIQSVQYWYLCGSSCIREAKCTGTRAQSTKTKPLVERPREDLFTAGGFGQAKKHTCLIVRPGSVEKERGGVGDALAQVSRKQ